MPRYVSDALLEQALGDKATTIIKDIKLPNDENTNNLEESQNFRHWKDFGSYIESLKPIHADTSDHSKSMTEYSRNPLNQPFHYKICNNCGTAILDDHIIEHLTECNRKNKNNNNDNRLKIDGQVKIDDKEKKGVDLDHGVSIKKENEIRASSSPKKGITSSTSTSNNKKVTKKRKNETAKSDSTSSKNNTEPDKKKAKTETKKKDSASKNSNKNKGPVDVERQCGVPLPNGGFCARSLTCKTHSMGAKRSVLGRSAPYDQLLAAYQRKNQAKLGAAAAAAQQAKDDLAHGSGVAIDEDDETQQVLAGVRRSVVMPLERRVCIPIKMRTGYLRMREMFATNLLPRLPNNPLGKMYARAAVMNVENIGESSFFPVRSQHQKNNQQKHAMKQSQSAIELQLQKQAQAQTQAQQQQAAMVAAATGKQNSNVNLPNGLNMANLTPQQQQMLMRQAQALQNIPES